MSVTRKTRIGAVSLAGLLAAALSVAAVTSAGASSFDAAKQERAEALGFPAEMFTAIDDDRMAEIVALFEADHDDETLQRELGAILDTEGEDDSTG